MTCACSNGSALLAAFFDLRPCWHFEALIICHTAVCTQAVIHAAFVTDMHELLSQTATGVTRHTAMYARHCENQVSMHAGWHCRLTMYWQGYRLMSLWLDRSQTCAALQILLMWALSRPHCLGMQDDK